MFIREDKKTKIQTEQQKVQKGILICGLLFALIVCRGINQVFVYIFAVVATLIFLLINVEECVLYFVFLAPFSIVLKTNIDGMTFYNILLLLVLLRVLVSVGNIEKGFMMLLLCFLTYCFVFSGASQITTTITIGAWLLLVYCIKKTKINGELMIWSYCSGLCLSCLVAKFRDSLPLIKQFLSIDIGQLKLSESSYAERFSGLQPNPNYLSLDITMAICCIIVLILLRKAKATDWVLLISLFVFGLMTISQSFIVGIIPLMILWILFSSKQGIGRSIKISIAVLCILAFLYLFARDYISLFLFRFEQKQGKSLARVTTGRSDIWIEYVQAIVSSPKILFVGNGLNTLVESGNGAHNTYLELIFSLGICGSLLYLILILFALKGIYRVSMLKIPIIVLLIRLFAITMTTWDNIWIYFIMFICISNSEENKTSQSVYISSGNRYIKY
ncbi:hypothetical protein JS518_03655 [Clostridiales bacterium FE2010]|nr:hypothetical protein JS518_03655 [Clostridiales bacterium FE2010]